MKHTHRWRPLNEEVDRCTVRGCGKRRKDDCKGGDLIWKPRRVYEPNECDECGHRLRGSWTDEAEPDIHTYRDRHCIRCGAEVMDSETLARELAHIYDQDDHQAHLDALSPFMQMFDEEGAAEDDGPQTFTISIKEGTRYGDD